MERAFRLFHAALPYRVRPTNVSFGWIRLVCGRTQFLLSNARALQAADFCDRPIRISKAIPSGINSLLNGMAFVFHDQIRTSMEETFPCVLHDRRRTPGRENLRQKRLTTARNAPFSAARPVQGRRGPAGYRYWGGERPYGRRPEAGQPSF